MQKGPAVGVRGDVVIVRTLRETGEVLGTIKNKNAFTNDGIAEIVKRFAGTGTTWAKDNISLTVDKTAGADVDFSAATAVIDGQKYLATFLDNAKTTYTIETNGLAMKLGSTVLSNLSSPTTTKPANEDWTFRWEVTFAVSGTGWTADPAMGASMASRLLGTAGTSIEVHIAAQATSSTDPKIGETLTYSTALTGGHQGNAAAKALEVNGSDAKQAIIRATRADQNAAYEVAGDRIRFSGSRPFAFSVDTGPDVVGANRHANFTYTLTFADS